MANRVQKLHSLQSANLEDKVVLMRVDIDAPVGVNNEVIDNTKLVDTVKTVNYCFSKKCKAIILISHFSCQEKIHDILQELYTLVQLESKRTVIHLDQCLGPELDVYCKKLPSETIAVLRNLSDFPGEVGFSLTNEKKVPASLDEVIKFREFLSSIADAYVYDVSCFTELMPYFSNSYLALSSALGDNFNENYRFMGIKLESSLKSLQDMKPSVHNLKKPIIAIVGGTDLEKKYTFIDAMLDQVTEILFGGSVALTFLKYKGYKIGSSLYDKDGAKIVKKLVDKAQEKNVKVHLPVDFITANKFAEDAQSGEGDIKSGIPDDWMGLDIGPKSAQAFCEAVSRAKVILWNGSMGASEWEKYCSGTRTVMNAVKDACSNRKVAFITGHSLFEFCHKWKFEKEFTYLSDMTVKVPTFEWSEGYGRLLCRYCSSSERYEDEEKGAVTCMSCAQYLILNATVDYFRKF